MATIEIYNLHRYLSVVKVELNGLPHAMELEVIRDIAHQLGEGSVVDLCYGQLVVAEAHRNGDRVQVSESFVCGKCGARREGHPHFIGTEACSCFSPRGRSTCHSILLTPPSSTTLGTG